MLLGSLALGGVFYLDRCDLYGNVLSRHCAKNGLTTEGLNHALDVVARQGANSTWKIGLIDDEGFDAVDAADTMSSHAGWTEITAYDEATRPLWGPGVITGKLAVNASYIAFNMNAAKSIKGMFLSSNNTKGGTTGILLCTGIFDDAASMLPAERAKGFYRLSAEGR